LDDYFGATYPETMTSKARFEAIDQAVKKRSVELVDLDYQRVHDTLILLLSQAQATFWINFPAGNGGIQCLVISSDFPRPS
jgi:hypothetical protein